MANRPKFKPKSNNPNRNMNKQNKSPNSKYKGVNPPGEKKTSDKTVKKFNDYVAHAPYNFVPLNTSVVPVGKPTCHDKYYPKMFTGYIDCELESLTPIYTRSTLTEDEVTNDGEAKNKSDFFSPAGKIRIPGSSLRGMIRNLLEIASWSKFGFYEDKNLYYRSFADVSSIRDEYKEHMNPEQEGSSVYNMSAGYLVKKDFEYSIYPAKEKPSKKTPTKNVQFEQIDGQSARKLVKNYSAINYYKLMDGRSLIVSGRMPRKKDWIINEIDRSPEKRIEISENDVINYEVDENRKAPSLLEWCKKDDEVPCFYVPWVDAKGNERISFGHTGLFRIAYKKSIKEHIPPVHNDENVIDFAHAIFGNTSKESTDSFAGRVFFEDAKLVDQNVNPCMEEKIPKILLGPKPTSFQLYLEQDSTNRKKLKHYNSETMIRGNKFYWHKSGDTWEKENQNEFNQKIETKIKAVKPTTLFKSKIRFENLSKNELGALLFVLKLPNGCAHKIGMGKPLGLGTIRITSKTYVSDRKARYLTLFDNCNWSLAEAEIKEKDVNEIIAVFENHILQNMSDTEKDGASTLWETYRLKQLSLLLNVDKGKELESKGKIDYMELSEFRQRNVLPHPENILNT